MKVQTKMLIAFTHLRRALQRRVYLGVKTSLHVATRQLLDLNEVVATFKV